MCSKVHQLALFVFFWLLFAPGAESQTVADTKEIVDLISLIDTSRDAVTGDWSRDRSAIESTGGRAILAIPVEPPRDYRWTVVIERKIGNGSINLVIPVGDRQTMIVLEGFGQKVNGLNLISGRSADRNETTSHTTVFKNGEPTTIVCTVHGMTVSVTCNGKRIINWQGSPAQLSLDRRYWSNVPPKRLAVAIYDSDVLWRLSKMQLEPTGGGTIGITSDVARSGDGQSEDVSLANSSANHGHASGESEMVTGNSNSAQSRQGSSLEPGIPESISRCKESVALLEHPLGSGTGFVIGENLLITNAHVVEDSFVDDIQVHFASAGVQRLRPKRVVYKNETCDLCILEIDHDQPIIPLQPEHVFRPGEQAAIIGNPSLKNGMLLRNAINMGTITALMRIDSYDFYQIRANVNPGSSGGPVLNSEGKLIAVVAMKATDEGEKEIREALKQLDDAFAAQFKQSGRKGIVYGVPVSAVSYALKQAQKQTEAQANQVNARHLTRTIFTRLTLIAGYQLLKLQANVPATVRQQARQIQMRGLPARTMRFGKNKLTFVALMPPEVAARVMRALGHPQVREQIRVFSDGLDTRIDQLSKHGNAADANVRRIRELQGLVKQVTRAGEHPPTDYQNYSQTLTRLNEELTGVIERLAETTN